MPRRPHDYHYIYKTTNLINQKFYIGLHSTSNLDDQYLGSGTYLKNSIKKYGRENFEIEILEWYDTRDEIKKREKDIVTAEFLKNEMCMNLKPGGFGGFINNEHKIKYTTSGGKAYALKLKNDPEFRQRMKIIKRINYEKFISQGKFFGSKTPFLGKSHTQEFKEMIGKKSSIHQKGTGNSQYGTCWVNNGKENKKVKKENLEIFLKENIDYIKGRKTKFL